MIVTRFGAERIVRYAFDYARAHGRKKVTLAHKANILKYTQGLFLDVGREMSEEYPDVEWEDRIIDATAMALVLDPYRFDVLVMENMFGDILSDLMAGLVGGLGFAPAGNIGEDAAMFEAVHGSAPDIAGQGVTNPLTLIMSSVMMLNHLADTRNDPACRAAGDRIKTSYNRALADGCHTRDLGGDLDTSGFVAALLERLD